MYLDNVWFLLWKVLVSPCSTGSKKHSALQKWDSFGKKICFISVREGWLWSVKGLTFIFISVKNNFYVSCLFVANGVSSGLTYIRQWWWPDFWGLWIAGKLSLDDACNSSIAVCCGRPGPFHCPKKCHREACNLLNRNGQVNKRFIVRSLAKSAMQEYCTVPVDQAILFKYYWFIRLN